MAVKSTNPVFVITASGDRQRRRSRSVWWW